MSKWMWLLAVVALAGCRDEVAEAPTQPAAGAGAETETETETETEALGGAGGAEQAELARAAEEAATRRVACVDAWLEAHDLNQFGDPVGTAYTGGTPLFDERTGERKDRLEHVFAKHGKLRETCQR